MITLIFSDEELQELAMMADAACRHHGARASVPVAKLLAKIEDASKADQKAKGDTNQ